VSEFDDVRERRKQFLRAAYDFGKSRVANLVSMDEIAQQMSLEWNQLENTELDEYAAYYGGKGLIKGQADGFGLFSITPAGIDEVEGNNAQEPPGSIFQFYGNVQGSVIGTHNTAELTNSFDFRAIEQRIEEEGGEEKEELRRALAQVQRLLERDEYLDRGALSQFSGAMEKHSWFTGSVMQALLGFATQAVG